MKKNVKKTKNFEKIRKRIRKKFENNGEQIKKTKKMHKKFEYNEKQLRKNRANIVIKGSDCKTFTSPTPGLFSFIEKPVHPIDFKNFLVRHL